MNKEKSELLSIREKIEQRRKKREEERRKSKKRTEAFLEALNRY